MKSPYCRRFFIRFLVATVLLAGSALQWSVAFADLDGLSITMDASQFNIGDSGGFCYAVPGAGQVTITNNNVNGTAQLLSRRDDGSGHCDSGAIVGPPGRYCVVILFAGEAGIGTAQNCYQVVDPKSVSKAPRSLGQSV